MIPQKNSLQEVSWQKLLQEAICDPLELLTLLKLEPYFSPAQWEAASRFSLKVPRQFVAKMIPGDLADPLLRQVLPLEEETHIMEGYIPDPLGERAASRLPGFLQKYHGRALLTLTGVCAVNCRYCFRREFPYHEHNPGRQGWQKVLEHIQQDLTLSEIILSGGDPLVMPDVRLKAFVHELSAIPHIQTLRIHTRLPVVIPERITPEFCEWFGEAPFHRVLVLHINHPNEIDEALAEALKPLKARGAILLNQSVLLKGVNDQLETLVALSRKQFSIGILPYYLHLLDQVTGSAHFQVPLEEAKALWKGMTEALPGYLVPRLVREEPGALSKTWKI